MPIRKVLTDSGYMSRITRPTSPRVKPTLPPGLPGGGKGYVRLPGGLDTPYRQGDYEMGSVTTIGAIKYGIPTQRSIPRARPEIPKAPFLPRPTGEEAIRKYIPEPGYRYSRPTLPIGQGRPTPPPRIGVPLPKKPLPELRKPTPTRPAVRSPIKPLTGNVLKTGKTGRGRIVTSSGYMIR